jgi:hypothetical protein
MNPDIAGISALVAGDAASFLSALNPSIFTIRTFSGQWASGDDTKQDIWRGILIGSALAMLVGFGGSSITRSYWPVVSVTIMLFIISAAYVWSLNNPRGIKTAALKSPSD